MRYPRCESVFRFSLRILTDAAAELGYALRINLHEAIQLGDTFLIANQDGERVDVA